MSQLHPDCPSDVNENNKVNNDMYPSILELCNDALLWVLEPDQSPLLNWMRLAHLNRRRVAGIFGALVSNDRAAVWVEGE